MSQEEWEEREVLREKNELLEARCLEMESRLAGLVELLEQSVSKAEELKRANDLFAERNVQLSNENIYLSNALDKLHDSYLNLFRENGSNQAELLELQRILKQQKGFQNDEEFSRWLKEVRNKEVEQEFQA